MKVLVAGATGAIGRQLVPALIEAGHEVDGMTRSEAKRELVAEMGANPVVADALDPDAVAEAVASSGPDAIIHQLTALGGGVDLKHMDRTFELTNRLRTEGTDHLLAAAQAAGVRRFLAQSYAGWPAREGGPLKDEQWPLDPDPPAAFRSVVEGIRHLEQAVTGAEWTEGIVLRYGGFYGPGTSFAPGGEQLEAIRRRLFPVIGGGEGIMSLIHVADAADATVRALERGRRGIYNVVDDDPAPAKELLPAVSSELGVRPPRRVPRWLARLLAGPAVVTMMTEGRGSLNTKAKRELGWAPAHPTWRGSVVSG